MHPHHCGAAFNLHGPLALSNGHQGQGRAGIGLCQQHWPAGAAVLPSGPPSRQREGAQPAWQHALPLPVVHVARCAHSTVPPRLLWLRMTVGARV